MNKLMTRKWLLMTLLLLFFYVLETSLFPLLIPASWRFDLSIYPKLVLVCVIYIGLFFNRHIGALYGLMFGMLQDVMFYGHMLGTNAFTYALSCYAAGLLFRFNAISLAAVFLAQLSCLLLYESSLYAIYRLFSITNVDFGWLFIHGMLPSLLISLFLALALYIPARKYIESQKTLGEADEE